MIAFRMFLRKSHILIHVECDDISEGNLTCLIHADEFLICSHRSASRRETQNKRLVCHCGFSLDS